MQGAIESELLCQLQKRAAGSVLSGVDELEILRRAFQHDIAAKSGLEHFELIQGQTRNAAVAGVFDFALRAVGGADDADWITAVALNFEVKAKRSGSDGY